MGNIILINPYAFPPPFTAPEINFAGEDVGITEGTNFPNGDPFVMPTNRFNEGDQIVVVTHFDYPSVGFTVTPAPRCSDDVDGTIGWANIFFSGDGASDKWIDIHFKTATGGETTINYATHATVDLVSYVLRFGPDDHLQFTSAAAAKGQNPGGTLADIPFVSGPSDASIGWFLLASDELDGTVAISPQGNYVLAAQDEDNPGGTSEAALSIWEQQLSYEQSTLTADAIASFGGIHARQITLSRKHSWSAPVFEGHQFTTGSISGVAVVSPSNPAGMQVGDLLLAQTISSNDTSTTTIWNGFRFGEAGGHFNQICNIASNAGQDWRCEWGWRIWDGTEPTWSVVNEGLAVGIEIIMYRVSGVNQAMPVTANWGSTYGNTSPLTYTIPYMNVGPNSLAVIGLATWATVGSVTTPPPGLAEYTPPTDKTKFWTGINEGQDPLPYGTIQWDSANPERGRFGFSILGEATYPPDYPEWPLIENYQNIDQEVLAWESGQTWNNFWGWGWKPDGTKFVTVNNSNDRMYGFDFGTPFDFTTTTHNSANPGQSVSVTGLDVFFNEDGTIYSRHSNYSTQVLQTYNCATPYEPATTDTLISSQAMGSYTANSSENYWIDRSGRHLFMSTSGNTPDEILHFIMTTPWDVTTIVQQADTYDLDADGIGNCGRIFMSPSGKDMLFSNPGNDTGIRHYKLAFPYDLNTMGEVSRLQDPFFARGGAIWMPDDASKLISGPGANDPYNIQVRSLSTRPTTPPQEAYLNLWLDAGSTRSYSGAGERWFDMSPYRNNALFLRGAGQCEAMYTGGTNGYFDFGTQATHQSRVFSIADHVSIQPDEGAGADPWTVSYLVAPNDVSTTSQDYIASKTNSFSMLYQYYSAGRFAPFLNASANWNDTFLEYEANEVNGWYLITMRSTGLSGVIDGNVNGNWNTDASVAAPAIQSTSGAWYLGGTNTSTGTLYSGRMAGVWFWKGVALSDVDVAQHVADIGARYTLSTSYK